MRQPRRRGRQRARDGRQVREGRRKGHEGGPRVPGPGRGQGARGVPEQGQGPVLLRPGDGRVRARAGGRRGAEEAQRPRRSPDARRVVRRRVPAGLPPAPGRADGLRRRVRPRRARRGASEAGVLRAHRPRQPPRRGLVAPAYARLPCPRARMASQRAGECLADLGSEDAKRRFVGEYLALVGRLPQAGAPTASPSTPRGCPTPAAFPPRPPATTTARPARRSASPASRGATRACPSSSATSPAT